MYLFQNPILGVYRRTLSDEPWSPPGVSMAAARKMWSSTRGGGAVVAVLDTGIDYQHPDLVDNVIGGISFIDSEPDYMDENGHGTHVAGTIAANGKILGVAPEAKLLAVKVLSKKGYGSYRGIIQGLEWARKWRGPGGEQVQVINMSLGGPVSEPGLHQEIQRVVKDGITVVCAAGNSGDARSDTREIAYPAYYPETIAVGAVDLKTGIANFSNSNDQIDIVAPGVDTYSSYPGKRYVKLSGTSMATPHITGCTALIYSRYFKRFKAFPTPDKVEEILHYLATDLGEVGYDELFGFGLFTFNLDGGKEIRLLAGSKQAYINDQIVELQHAPSAQEGTILASVQEVAGLLNTDSIQAAPGPGHPQGQVLIYG